MCRLYRFQMVKFCNKIVVPINQTLGVGSAIRKGKDQQDEQRHIAYATFSAYTSPFYATNFKCISFCWSFVLSLHSSSFPMKFSFQMTFLVVFEYSVQHLRFGSLLTHLKRFHQYVICSLSVFVFCFSLEAVKAMPIFLKNH